MSWIGYENDFFPHCVEIRTISHIFQSCKYAQESWDFVWGNWHQLLYSKIFGKMLFQVMLTQLHWPFALQECLALYSSCHIVYLGKALLRSFFFSGSVLIHKHSWILSESVLFLLEYYMMTQLVPLLPLQALIQTCDNANLLSQFLALVFIFP